MAKKKKEANLSEIVTIAAEHFSVSEDDVRNMKNNKENVRLARVATVFVASRADYSNQEIANELNYRSAGHVSTTFNRAQGIYANSMTEENAKTARHFKAIAKAGHISLE